MKQILLSLSCGQLFAEVERTTAYLGAKQAPAESPGSHFDRVAATTADRPLLRRFSLEALSTLAERLKGIVSAIDTGADPSAGSEPAFALTLTLSEAYDSSLTPSARANFEGYMAAFVTSRWLRLSAPDKEAPWQTEARRLLLEITSTLYHRNPPKRN